MSTWVESGTTRVLYLVGLLTLGTTFSLWFLGEGPFTPHAAPASASHAREDGRVVSPALRPSGRRRRPVYPLQVSASREVLPEAYGAEPDFDPHARQEPLPTEHLPLAALLRRIPPGPSLLVALRMEELGKQPWAEPILAGRHLAPLRRLLLRLGLDPTKARRAVLGVRLEARAPAPPMGTSDLRFLGSRDRPFYLVMEGRVVRKPLLRAFRKGGPLTATLAFGRRIYRRPGDYSLAFPMRGLVLWAYRLPMGPLLQRALAHHASAARHAQPFAARTAAAQPFAARTAAARTAAAHTAAARTAAARTAAARTAAARTAAARTAAARTTAARTAAALRIAGISLKPAHSSSGQDRSNRDPDAHAPWITAVWTPLPKTAIPYPLNRLKGYTAKPSLRGAVLTVDPAPAHPDRVRVRLRLLYRETASPPLLAAVLRYARQTLAQNPRVRRAHLDDLVRAAHITVHPTQLHVDMELRPWHLRALTLLAHKLLATE